MSTLESLTFRDFWRIAVRRKWLILSTVLLSVVVAGTLCVVLPKIYRSTSMILMEETKIPKDYVAGIVEPGGRVQKRIWGISQRVTSRKLVGRVIEGLKLYEEDVQKYGLEAVINKVRRAIEVEEVWTEGTRGKKTLMPVEAFTLSFSHEDPVTAMKVTSGLASKFLEQNVMLREQIVESTSEFLDMELKKAKRELERQESKMKQFKSQHLGELPQQMEPNLRALDRLANGLTNVTESIQRQSDRLGRIEKGIVEYETTGIATSE